MKLLKLITVLVVVSLVVSLGISITSIAFHKNLYI